MSATGAVQGLFDFKEYASGAPADAVTWAAPGQANWVQVIGAGSVVVTPEKGTNRTITTDAIEPIAEVRGAFSGFVSSTALRVRMGTGSPPPIVIPATAVPATTAAVGGATMSVAPAVAATPIATGTNDPRVCTVEIQVYLAAADGVFVESTVWIPGVIGTITGATVSANASVAQSNTDYLTFTLGIRDGAGGAASTVASQVTKASGASFVGLTAVSLGAIGNATTAAISQVTFKSVKSGAGQASTGPALLRITYTVP